MRKILLLFFFGSWAFNAFANEKIEYVTQILEPTGGNIQKPKDWFYSERHGGSSLTWILSEENPDDGPYNTGVRIQLIQGIKAGTGKTPEEFVARFASDKEKTSEILSECERSEQDLFYRVCLETKEIAVEGTKVRSHIQYSMFWNNELDIGIFVTAGTSEELWETKKEIFKKMEAFEFIDMKRFEKNES
ncbi:hypothetical protein SAMN02745866_04365 [Alteromonadaceae bacterium Bs31]|nr:hypothetical protein SAMN02745866_04365 [Alteromonadaceae bacterium Bs31]